MYEQITTEQRDDVLLITLNRPERLNAWTPKMHKELQAAIVAANDDDATGAIVVTGSGRGFCAGADIGSEFEANLDTETRPESERSWVGVWVKLVRSSKPLIAAINGPAIGVGLTMILSFDHLMASDEARLSCRFIKMGITPELASSHFLVQRMGWGAASDLALTGRMVNAPEALEMRLVDSIAPVGELVEAAVAKAREFGENPDPQLRMIKQLLTENSIESDLIEVEKRELAALDNALKTPEHREAVAAFMEKRAPKFR